MKASNCCFVPDPSGVWEQQSRCPRCKDGCVYEEEDMPKFKIYRWEVNGIMFYWDVFNMMEEKYGGHGQWIGRRLGRLVLLDYLSFVFSPKSWKWGHFYIWYDGPHHSWSIGPLTIAWGGPPVNGDK